ncbi:type I-E CRISPR-associated protein Cse1/CasA [Neptunomonas sp.]|uniref:type I-E CRISPR-associated protein Cse1/CasA n=1 Tax=Neptunomonas sp. TaxID=1971898 RepID=UPI003563324F
MNLVKDPWLPFRLRDGSEQVLPMSAICRTDVVDFALHRADFQGAAYQFAIGLLQTVFAPADKYEWHNRYELLPDKEVLKKAFDQVAHAYKVTGDGPLFMQDYQLLENQQPTTVSGLLIEAPGANGIKLNTDHFVKRGIGEVMSLEMAVLALFTLQINAPSGGAGHRVGLRGGGPLTTLVLPQSADANLWQKLWMNVVSKDFWRYPEPNFNDGSVFPWLTPTKTSEKKGSEIYVDSVHPLHMYWAMPRRIRLEVESNEAECQISGKLADQTVYEYRTQNYGGNYSGKWEHPLTSYKWNPKKPDEEPLSAKGQPGGITYKVWDALTFSSDVEGQKCALVVQYYSHICSLFPEMHSEVPRLWVFGYDMDNMKARCWYSAMMPLFSVEPEQEEDTLNAVKTLQKLASDALWHCRTQIKAAWFESPGDVKGDMSFIDLAFWQRSEPAFYLAVSQLVTNSVKESPFLAPAQAGDWLHSLQGTVTDLFDEYALSELGTERSMAKRIKARHALTGWLYGGKDIKVFIKEQKIDQLKEAG